MILSESKADSIYARPWNCRVAILPGGKYHHVCDFEDGTSRALQFLSTPEAPPQGIFELHGTVTLIKGDCSKVLQHLPSESVDCVITSPPYWNQRGYEVEDEERHHLLGNEASHLEYVVNLTSVFSQVKRVLKKEGSLWLNLGDKYVNKNLMGLPWRVAIALQDDGWILRNDIIWDQMKGTQSASDRLRDIYEHVFHFVKQKRYHYDTDEIRISPVARPRNRNGTMISATGVSGKKYRRQIEESIALSAVEKEQALQALQSTIERDAKRRSSRLPHDYPRISEDIS